MKDPLTQRPIGSEDFIVFSRCGRLTKFELFGDYSVTRHAQRAELPARSEMKLGCPHNITA